MDSATATAAVQNPGGRYGDLSPLARQALQPRVSRIETALELNAGQAGRLRTAETGTSGAAPPEFARAAARLAQTAEVALSQELPAQPVATAAVHSPRERRGDPPPVQENPAYSLASFRAAEPSTSAPAEKLTDPDGYGRALRSVQSELRGLRADIAALAQALGQPPPSPDVVAAPAGALQQHDPLSPQVQAKHFAMRQEAQAITPQQIADNSQQQVNARRLTLKQEQLLRALQRAEQRLQNSPPGTVPPALRNEVIGEILRAKYNVALFGGLGGAALTGHLASAVV